VYPELNIDLFASRLNDQLDVYYSWKPDPGCTYVDAFSIDWGNFNFFAFPPFSLIPRCVQNILLRQGTGNTTDPCVVNKDVFPTCSATVIHPTVDLQTISKPAMPCPLQGAPPATQELVLDGLSFIKNTFAQQNLSPDITKILMASWRKGTQNQYKTYVEKWLALCCERKIDHSSPQISEALQFLIYFLQSRIKLLHDKHCKICLVIDPQY